MQGTGAVLTITMRLFLTYFNPILNVHRAIFTDFDDAEIWLSLVCSRNMCLFARYVNYYEMFSFILHLI